MRKNSEVVPWKALAHPVRYTRSSDMPRTTYRPEVAHWLTDLATTVLGRHVAIGEPTSTDPRPVVDSTSPRRRGLQSEAHTRRLEALFRILPAHERIVLQLHDLEGLSYEEIARGMARSSGTIRSRAHRARRRLTTLHPSSFGPEAPLPAEPYSAVVP